MPHVIIYSTPTCGYCKLAKEYFKQHNVVFIEKDVTVDQEAREHMIQTSGQLGVPVIEIGDQMVIGFDKGKLAQLLNIQ